MELDPPQLNDYAERLEAVAARKHPRTLSELEADLELSAEIGAALVKTQVELGERLHEAETTRDEVLERLGQAYRREAELERRTDAWQEKCERAEKERDECLHALARVERRARRAEARSETLEQEHEASFDISSIEACSVSSREPGSRSCSISTDPRDVKELRELREVRDRTRSRRGLLPLHTQTASRPASVSPATSPRDRLVSVSVQTDSLSPSLFHASPFSAAASSSSSAIFHQDLHKFPGLSLFLAHVEAFLERTAAADVASISARLRRHALPLDDAPRLAALSLKHVFNDVSGLTDSLRNHKSSFWIPPPTNEQHSSVLLPDLRLLARLFKDLLFSHVRYKAISNTVALDPSLAYLVNDDLLDSSTSSSNSNNTTVPRFLSPLTRWLQPKSSSNNLRSTASNSQLEKSTGSISVPKRSAATSVANATVSIEVNSGRSQASVRRDVSDPSLHLSVPPPAPLSSSSSPKARKAHELNSFFVGSLSKSPTPATDNWVMLSSPNARRRAAKLRSPLSSSRSRTHNDDDDEDDDDDDDDNDDDGWKTDHTKPVSTPVHRRGARGRIVRTSPVVTRHSRAGSLARQNLSDSSLRSAFVSQALDDAMTPPPSANKTPKASHRSPAQKLVTPRAVQARTESIQVSVRNSGGNGPNDPDNGECHVSMSPNHISLLQDLASTDSNHHRFMHDKTSSLSQTDDILSRGEIRRDALKNFTNSLRALQIQQQARAQSESRGMGLGAATLNFLAKMESARSLAPFLFSSVTGSSPPSDDSIHHHHEHRHKQHRHHGHSYKQSTSAPSRTTTLTTASTTDSSLSTSLSSKPISIKSKNVALPRHVQTTRGTSLDSKSVTEESDITDTMTVFSPDDHQPSTSLPLSLSTKENGLSLDLDSDI